MKNSKPSITSWSYSRYATYTQCPAKAKYKFVLKIKEPSNDAMDRGSEIHKVAESYVKGVGRAIPLELKLFGKLFKQLRKQYKSVVSDSNKTVIVEQTLAFTKNWAETRWDDWNGCAVRVKIDCTYLPTPTVAEVVDWKTGKFNEGMYESYKEQLELYALAVLLYYPALEEVRPKLCNLDLGITYPPEDSASTFTRKDIPRLKALWAKRTKPMLNDTIFAPRPNDKCRYCSFRAGNGGPCKY